MVWDQIKKNKLNLTDEVGLPRMFAIKGSRLWPRFVGVGSSRSRQDLVCEGVIGEISAGEQGEEARQVRFQREMQV